MRIKWRNLELPSRVAAERGLTDTYGKFVAEPFERGFGITVGNSLRRVLLSSLEGSGVTRVKIQGVQHEVSTIPGVVEDVTDIILNIKALVVKNNADSLADDPDRSAPEGRGQGGRHSARRGHPDCQSRARHRHADRRRAIRRGNDRREWSRLSFLRRQRRQGT